MSISSTVRVLRQSTLFGTLGNERLNVLAFSAERRVFNAGDVIMEGGLEPPECLVVIRGQVEIRLTGATMTTYEAGPGATVGEVPLITNSAANATITAVTEGEAMVISRQLFERMIDDFPDLATQLRSALVRRLDRTITDLRAVESVLRGQTDGDSQDQTVQPQARGRTDAPSRAQHRRP